MKNRPLITVTRKLTDRVEKALSERFDARLNDRDVPLSESQLKTAMCESDAVLCTVSDKLNHHVLTVANRRATMVANFGVGFSNIDTDTARKEDIVVSNTPDVLTDATADIALLLILATTRRAYRSEALLRSGHWTGFSIAEDLGMSIQGKTLGIIGMGRIGQAVARRAALGFGMEVAYYNRSELNTAAFDYPAVAHDSMASVMSSSDVVSIHIPGAGEGMGPVITRELIGCMPSHSFLINTARGDLIDEDALITALEKGQIAGAGLDVYASEPQVPDRLRVLKNVSLLPHVGSATEEVRDAMGMLALENLVAHFSGGQYPSRIV